MITKSTEPLAGLYDADETAWLDAMSELIGDGDHDALDYANLGEYLADMALRHRKKVESRSAILAAHVLKWIHQPDKRSQSWRGTIVTQRFKLTKLLESGALRRHAEAVLVQCYAEAVDMATEETGLPVNTFPSECLWTLDQLMSAEVLGD